MKNRFNLFMGILLACLIAANISTAINDVWMLDKDLQIKSAPESTNLIAMAQKGSKKRSLRNSSPTSPSEENHSVSVSSTPHPQQSSQWITAKNSNCKVLVDSSVSNPSCTWTGGCLDEKANGYGLMVIYSGDKEIASYKGNMTEGKPEGYGVYTEPGGNTYEGELKNGQMEGRGIYSINKPIPNSANILFQVKSSIIGEFRSNQPFLCKYVQDTGSGYGGFSQWQLQGKAVVYGPDFTLMGEFQNSIANGLGVVTIKKNGIEHRYEGQIVNNVPKSFSLTMNKLLGAKQLNIKNSKACQVGEEAQQIASLAKQKAEDASLFVKLEKEKIARAIEEKKRLEEERIKKEEIARRETQLKQQKAKSEEKKEREKQEIEKVSVTNVADPLQLTKETIESLGLDSAKLIVDYDEFINPNRYLEYHEKNNGIMTFGKKYENQKLSVIEQEFIKRGLKGGICKEGKSSEEALKNTLHALLAINICSSADIMAPNDRVRYLLLGFFVLELYRNNPINKQVEFYEALKDASDVAFKKLQKPYGGNWAGDIIRRAAYVANKYPTEFSICAGIGFMGLCNLGEYFNQESFRQLIEEAKALSKGSSLKKYENTPASSSNNSLNISPSSKSPSLNSSKSELTLKAGERIHSVLSGGIKKSVAISKERKYPNRTEWTLTTESGVQKILSFYPNAEKKYSIGILNYSTMEEALTNFVKSY